MNPADEKFPRDAGDTMRRRRVIKRIKGVGKITRIFHPLRERISIDARFVPIKLHSSISLI